MYLHKLSHYIFCARRAVIHSSITVQDEILARVIFGEIVLKTFWRINYWGISHAYIRVPMQEYHWWIKYWQKISNHQNVRTARQYFILYGRICIEYAYI